MSDWHDNMRAAKFRGVRFFVESAERGGGRRTVTHEYPFKTDPFVEDMGRKAVTFPVEGYVIGADYLDQRDALLTALEKEGPGELQHPYHGTRSVAVTSYRVRESVDRGGMAQFSIEFTETPAQPAQPTAVQDAAAKVTASATSAIASVSAEFLAAFDSGLAQAETVAAQVRSATNAINRVLSTIDMEAQKIASLTAELSNFADAAQSVATDPANLLAGQVSIFEHLADGIADSLDPIKALAAIYAFDPGTPPSPTTSRRTRELANFNATHAMIQRLAAIQAARLAVTLTFPSYEDAARARATVTALLDEQAEAAGDNLYPALQQLRTDLVRAVPGDGDNLAHLISHTPALTVPSLVLAHRLYTDLTLEPDLVARNRVRNPFFVLGGVELEVLSRE